VRKIPKQNFLTIDNSAKKVRLEIFECFRIRRRLLNKAIKLLISKKKRLRK